MADYRRFISYMYMYENGIKSSNHGFVRVESRNGQCRVGIHMTGLQQQDTNLQVYMLIREVGGYIGIVAGKLQISGQTGECSMVTDSRQLMGTAYRLEHISGIVVLDDKKQIYGTRWDDTPLETECFRQRKAVDDRLVLFCTEQKDTADSKPAVDVGKKSEEPVETEPENIYDRVLRTLPQMYPFDDNSMNRCVRLDLQDIGRLPLSCWLYGSNSFLLHGYYCYRHLILAELPMHTENGSTKENGHGYLLGVPGTWQYRERYMAQMFGFHHFKPVSRENTEKGAFGYWYIFLH